MIVQSHQEGGLRSALIAYLNSCHGTGLFHESGDNDHQPHATKACCSELQRLVNLWYWTGLKRSILINVVALQVKENHHSQGHTEAAPKI